MGTPCQGVLFPNKWRHNLPKDGTLGRHCSKRAWVLQALFQLPPVLMLGPTGSPGIPFLTLILTPKLGSEDTLSFLLVYMPVSWAKSIATGYFWRTCRNQFSLTFLWVRSIHPLNLTSPFYVNAILCSDCSQWIWIAVIGTKNSVIAKSYCEWLIIPHPIWRFALWERLFMY